jgi:TP901-1 family phage major tail protein
MTKYLGKNFLVQVGDVATPTNFVTVASMRATQLSINNEQIDVTEKDVMPARELLEGGLRSFDISLSGPMSDGASLTTMRSAANTGQIRYFKVLSGLGDTWVGKFQVASMERNGDHDKEETYTLKLMSSGTITYTP